jgi:capsular polysaccharide biosynthesis protein
VQGPADRRNSASDEVPAPRRNRAIILVGLALCVVGAVVVAYLLGLLDRIGLLS